MDVLYQLSYIGVGIQFYFYCAPGSGSAIGAEDGARTRHPQLGRLMLYQMSYFRMWFWGVEDRLFA